MKLFDSHCHLHFSQFDNDREEVISRLKEAGIKVINVGTDLEDSKKAVDLANKYPDQIWASVGLHPDYISTTNRRSSESSINKLAELAKDERVVAIGECGLDYFKTKKSASDRTRSLEMAYAVRQKEIFIKQIELAKELNKPIILHCRPSTGTQDAYEDASNIIQNSKFQILNSNNGAAHFFAGSKETAKKFLDLGFYIGFAGPITFHPTGDHPKGGANPYEELVQFVPLDRILIETDAPFAAPAPYRGKRNEPAYVEFVARKIAEWKGLGFDKVATQTHNNAKALFKI